MLRVGLITTATTNQIGWAAHIPLNERLFNCATFGRKAQVRVGHYTEPQHFAVTPQNRRPSVLSTVTQNLQFLTCIYST